MADDDVRSKFGADVTGLLAGVEKVKEAIKSVTAPVEDLKATFREISEAIAVAFGVEKIAEFVESAAEMGEQIVRTSAMIGASAKETQELGIVAKTSGTSTQVLAMSMERLQTNLQRAQSATSVQAKALHELGLNAKEMLSVPIPEQIEKMADAYKRLVERGINPTSAGMLLMGRGALTMAPMLMQGHEAVQELTKSLEEAGGVMTDQTVATLDVLHEKIVLMGTAWDNLKGTIVATAAPAFEGLIKILTDLFGAIKVSIDEGGIFAVAIRGMAAVLQVFDSALAVTIGAVHELWIAIKMFYSDTIANFKFIGTVVADTFKDVWDLVSGVVKSLADQFHELGRLIKDVFTLNIDDAKEAWTSLMTHMSAPVDFSNIKTAYAGFVADAQARHDKLWAEMKSTGLKTVEEIETAINGVKPPEMSPGGLKAPSMDLTNQALKLAMEKYQDMIKAADDAYKLTQTRLASELKMHEITQTEETRQLLAALDARLAAENVAFEGEKKLYQKGTAEYVKVVNQQQEAYRKYIQERQAITQKAVEAEYAMWKSGADQVAGAINGQLKSVLSGQENLRQALAKISSDIALKFIQDQIKVTLEWLANQARILAAHVAAEAGMTAASTAGAAARSAIEVASGQTSIFQTIANALKSIFASAGQTDAAVTAAVAPVAGPAAPGIGAAAAAATVGSSLGFIASAEVGGYVVEGGLVNVHPGEILPAAKVNQPYMGPSQGGGGGFNPTFQLQAFNPAGLQQLLRSSMPQFAREYAAFLSNNPSFNRS